jgi:aerotaxis receptor
MSRHRPLPVNEERPFQIEELFFSTTDEQGIVRYGNEVFKRISGYSEEELLGAPHSLIRHPDMPRSVFWLLWEYIQSGRTIAAYVKNMAKDGRYYWVLATAMPCRGGYVSIRLKPSSPYFEAAQAVYREALAVERAIEVDPARRKEAIAAGAEKILVLLGEAGFASYDEFMRTALAAELQSRALAIKGAQDGAADRSTRGWRRTSSSLASICGAIHDDLNRMFQALGQLRSMQDRFQASAKELREISTSIHIASLNATINSQRLGTARNVLAVVADLLGEKSGDTIERIASLSGGMQSLAKLLGPLLFDVAVTELQGEVCKFFADEITQIAPSPARSHATEGVVQESLEILFDELSTRCRTTFSALHQVHAQLDLLRTPVSRLAELLREMRVVQFTGRKEALVHPEGGNFAIVFEEVAEQIARSEAVCGELLDCVKASEQELRSAIDGERRIEDGLSAAGELRAVAVA